MNIFINGLKDEIKNHVILNRPTTFAEAENLARLREVVSSSSDFSPPKATSASQDLRIKEFEGQVNLLISMANKNNVSNLPINALATRAPFSDGMLQNPRESKSSEERIVAAMQAGFQQISKSKAGNTSFDFNSPEAEICGQQTANLSVISVSG